MSAKVEIYTMAYCAFCQRAKDLLRIKGVPFVEYDITDDKPRAAEMQLRSQQQAIPGIFINDAPVGGCAELFDLDERGELDPLLKFAEFSSESFQ